METLFGDAARDKVDGLVEVLWLTPGWPKDPQRDREFCGELLRQFPDKDLEDELGAWRVWLLANGKKEMVTSRGRFARVRNWCSHRFIGGQGGKAGSPPTRQRRAGTAARPAAVFGESRVLEGW